MWGIIAEDLPEESNRVTLDPRRSDAFGIPAARLRYRLSENSRRLVAFHQARARESLAADICEIGGVERRKGSRRPCDECRGSPRRGP